MNQNVQGHTLQISAPDNWGTYISLLVTPLSIFLPPKLKLTTSVNNPYHAFCSAAAAAAKSLQSCPTLCDPIDSSPPGSPDPGILQARTLEWVTISFSNA